MNKKVSGYRIDIWEDQASDNAMQGRPDNAQEEWGPFRSSTLEGIRHLPRDQIDLSDMRRFTATVPARANIQSPE